VPDFAHQAGCPPTSNEKSDKMHRAEEANLAAAEIIPKARQCIKRANRTGGQLQKQDGQQQGCKGNQHTHMPIKTDGTATASPLTTPVIARSGLRRIFNGILSAQIEQKVQ